MYQLLTGLILFPTFLLLACFDVANAQAPKELQFQTRKSEYDQPQSDQRFKTRNDQSRKVDRQVNEPTELEAALLELENVNTQNTKVLQDLLTQVPPQARPAIENALQRSQMGRQRAQQARLRATTRKRTRQTTQHHLSGQTRNQPGPGYKNEKRWESAAGNQTLASGPQKIRPPFESSLIQNYQKTAGVGQTGNAQTLDFTKRTPQEIWNQRSELSPAAGLGQNANSQASEFMKRSHQEIWNQPSELSSSAIEQGIKRSSGTMQRPTGQSSFGQNAFGQSSNVRGVRQQSPGGSAFGKTSSGTSSFNHQSRMTRGLSGGGKK